jgi:putative copper export protein
VTEFLASIEASPFAMAITESTWLFPAFEVVHVIAIALVVGSIAMLDLRLLGVSRRDRGVVELSAETLPWTWGAFGLAVVSGLLMFVSSATRYYENTPFRVKMLLLVLAGLNMAWFHFKAYRTVHDWDRQLPTPRAARVAGSLSLSFWVLVVFFGRWIGFV